MGFKSHILYPNVIMLILPFSNLTVPFKHGYLSFFLFYSSQLVIHNTGLHIVEQAGVPFMSRDE